MRTAQRRRIALGLVVVGTIALVYAGYMLTGGRMDVGDKTSSIVGAVMGFLSLALGLISLILQMRAVPPLDETLAAVAGDTARRWRDELTTRGIDRPLMTRWSTVGAGTVEGRVLRDRGSGDITEVESRWRELKHPLLVVVGAPGAGKTSLLMVLVEALARNHSPGDPVPVMLDLSAWPNSNLPKWIVGEVAKQWGVSAKTAAVLFDRGKVLPVLDGLDELQPKRHKTAVETISQWSGGVRPCVVACRVKEYLEAVAAYGEQMVGATVVEVQPLETKDVAVYLSSSALPSNRWSAVVEHCVEDPEGDLAKVLRRPLMAYLARNAYRDPSTDPTELTTFSSKAAIEKHLLSRYIPSMYDERLWSHTTSRYTTAQALKWLTPLAVDSQYHSLTNRNLPAIGWHTAVGASAIAGLIGWASRGLLPPTALTAFALAATFLVTLVCVGALMGKVSWGMALFTGFPGVAVIVGSMTWWHIPVAVATLVGLVAVGGISARAGPETVRKARWIYPALAVAVVIAAPVVLLVLASNSVEVLIGYAAMGAVVLLVIFLLPLLRYLNYAMAALLGRVPWRPEEFLRDAHRRGVLRKTGDGYRFRHEYLRDYLAP
ncbi:NACHT domain-containing protein [Actinokineospora globicatena]|uniref:NACHT domain-containing protein n=1 Tax=Actinokineospora globicatena TaxID=103729 RepID=UPI0020A24EDD|nr:NACHT domain-containing protein [Actinokineospora globicatena]MCP2305767.1 NACHT domain-containing protein [Actinokineospora globicatena]GLW80378.1 hypothetical protein Aglo01_48590 [Actinokineospora globicatena]GLW87207.1 hypothetical protein Aglo02_48460 [Actinokineospora globicatena]